MNYDDSETPLDLESCEMKMAIYNHLDLLKGFEFLESVNSNEALARITTYDADAASQYKTYTITASIQGWRILNNDDVCFDTFDYLMRYLSPAYRSRLSIGPGDLIQVHITLIGCEYQGEDFSDSDESEGSTETDDACDFSMPCVYFKNYCPQLALEQLQDEETRATPRQEHLHAIEDGRLIINKAAVEVLTGRTAAHRDIPADVPVDVDNDSRGGWHGYAMPESVSDDDSDDKSDCSISTVTADERYPQSAHLPFHFDGSLSDENSGDDMESDVEDTGSSLSGADAYDEESLYGEEEAFREQDDTATGAYDAANLPVENNTHPFLYEPEDTHAYPAPLGDDNEESPFLYSV